MEKFMLTLPQLDGVSTLVITGNTDGSLDIEAWSPDIGADCVYLESEEVQKLLTALQGDV
jgi:hypothetical protein